MTDSLLHQVIQWDNLLLAFRKAAKGKRGKSSTARLEARLADELLVLQAELETGTYLPGGYKHFHIQEPKRRKISAAPFRDRVVHHALCNVIEPLFERGFIDDSFANRCGKGTHRAIDRFQRFAQRYPYVLRADVVQHFAAIDHEILLRTLTRRLPDASVAPLIEKIVASGQGVLEQEYRMRWFPGDDLLAACRPRGLPIGNLTSQFWSVCWVYEYVVYIVVRAGFSGISAPMTQHISVSPLRLAISLSGGRNLPRLSVGGSTASMALSFSVGSARK